MSGEPLTIEVLIKNNNEDAFEAAFYMMTPKDLQFTKLQQLGEKIDMPITCSAPDASNNYTLKCDIGNPLKGGNMVSYMIRVSAEVSPNPLILLRQTHFAVSFVPAEKHTKTSSYDFYWVANSTNVERKNSEYDNVGSKSIGVWVETDLTIKGTSLPDYQVYKAADYKAPGNATTEDELGPQVVHIYELRNNLSSFIEGAAVDIYYPYQTESGDPLMYIVNQPETGGKIRCDKIEVNELGLKLNEKQKNKSYLHAQGAISNSVPASSEGQASSEESGGHVEISHGIQTGNTVGVTVGNDNQRSLTAKQKELLEREDAQDAAGDASFVHLDRANQADSHHEANFNQSSGSFARAGFIPAAPSDELHSHSTHGHIQMAPPQVSSSSRSSSSSSYQMRPQQQQQRQQQLYLAGGSPDKSMYGGRNGNFHAGTLDLDTFERGNVDNELHNSQVQYGQPAVQRHVVYSSGSKPYYGRENEDFYDEDNQQQKALGQWHSSSSSSSGAPRRFRRDMPTTIETRLANGISPCLGVKCRRLRCYLENLGYEDADAAFVAIRARMVATTMEKLAPTVPLNVSTLAVANVTSLPFIGKPKEKILKTHEIFYKAQPEPQQVPDVVPLWVVVLAACAGALIFLLLVLLLYKVSA